MHKALGRGLYRKYVYTFFRLFKKKGSKVNINKYYKNFNNFIFIIKPAVSSLAKRKKDNQNKKKRYVKLNLLYGKYRVSKKNNLEKDKLSSLYKIFLVNFNFSFKLLRDIKLLSKNTSININKLLFNGFVFYLNINSIITFNLDNYLNYDKFKFNFIKNYNFFFESILKSSNKLNLNLYNKNILISLDKLLDVKENNGMIEFDSNVTKSKK